MKHLTIMHRLFIYKILLKCWNLIIQAVKYLEPQIRLAAKAGKHKKEYKLSMLSDRTLERVRELAEAPIEAVFTDPTYGKVHIVYTCSQKSNFS